MNDWSVMIFLRRPVGR